MDGDNQIKEHKLYIVYNLQIFFSLRVFDKSPNHRSFDNGQNQNKAAVEQVSENRIQNVSFLLIRTANGFCKCSPWTQNFISGIILFLTVGIYLAIIGESILYIITYEVEMGT